MRTKLFWDMEFSGLMQNAQPISLGIVAETGQTFYAEWKEVNLEDLDEWQRENVVPYLRFAHERSSDPRVDLDHHAMKEETYLIKIRLEEWLAQFEGPSPNPTVEFWGDVLAWDWVLLCELFGGAMSLPPVIYYIPFDITTIMRVQGVDPDASREEFAGLAGGKKHNALWDAKVIKACYGRLVPRTEKG
jgi:hypothetical protein